MAAPKDETPTSDQASGVSGEQLSFLPTPAFCPILPPPHSAAALALRDLLEGAVTQLDWLRAGRGWRLAAAIKTLGYLGWQPKSSLVYCADWPNPIAEYELSDRAKEAAASLRKAGGAHA